MKAKEKAQELVDKYLDLDNYNNLNLDLFCDECGVSMESAKYMSLIAVDEVIKSQKNIYGLNNKATKFYLEVQQEIQKL
jgi:hypothetical protein